MGKNTDNKSPQRDNDVIDRIYEVAVDPSRYEALLDRWEEMIGPQRAGAHARPSRQDPALNLDHLTGHIERADQVLDRVIRQDAPKGAEAVVAQIDRSAAFAVDSSLHVITHNRTASQQLGITLESDLDELTLGDRDSTQLAHHVRRLFNANDDAPLVLRARDAENDRLIVFHLRCVRSADAAPYILVLSSDMGWPAGFTEMLKAAFDFTPAETEVVRALTEGGTLAQVAEQRGRSIDTIRAQLKSIMAKTETRSQTELVRLTLSTMEIAQFTATATDQIAETSQGFDSLQAVPFQTLCLPDGRRMDYLILGDPQGAPLMYLPLDYGLVRWPADAENEARKRGIRVIVPVRAGYGHSTALPKRTPYVPQLVDDLVALMDYLGVAAAPFLSLGGDSHIATIFHTSYPERISALVACAGVLPMTRSEQYDRMDKWHRFILAGARYTPHLLPFMVKAGFALAKRLGKRGFLHAVYGKSDADMNTVADPAAFEALVVGSEVCLSERHSAHDAFSREVIAHETTDWIEDVLAMKGEIPVIFMNGLQDPQTPPATLAEFKADYPWIVFDIFPDGGQLLFFSKWRQVLDRVQDFLT